MFTPGVIAEKVYLEFHRHRWKCCECSHAFEAAALRKKLWTGKEGLKIGYGTLPHLLERETDGEMLGCIEDEDEIYLGIDEHSFRQKPVHAVIEVKRKRAREFFGTMV